MAKPPKKKPAKKAPPKLPKLPPLGATLSSLPAKKPAKKATAKKAPAKKALPKLPSLGATLTSTGGATPAWEFSVEAVVTSSGAKAVTIRVAPGIPLAVLRVQTARSIARALERAADAHSGGGTLPVLPGLGGTL